MRHTSSSCLSSPAEANEEIVKVTYGELRSHVALFAAAMRKMGIQTGDRVAGGSHIYFPLSPLLTYFCLSHLSPLLPSHFFLLSSLKPVALWVGCGVLGVCVCSLVRRAGCLGTSLSSFWKSPFSSFVKFIFVQGEMAEGACFSVTPHFTRHSPDSDLHIYTCRPNSRNCQWAAAGTSQLSGI